MIERYLTKKEIKEMHRIDLTIKKLSKPLAVRVKKEVIYDLYNKSFCEKNNIDYLDIKDSDFYKTMKIVLREHNIRIIGVN